MTCLSFHSRSGFILALSCLLASCIARPDTGALQVVADPVAGATQTRLLVATTRARASAPEDLFGTRRAKSVGFGEVTVSIPPHHEPAQIELPLAPPGDPRRHFVVRDAQILENSGAFRSALTTEIERTDGEQRSAVLFIHGYNTRFAEGVFRLAQLSADSPQKSTPVLFSWASAGTLQDYVTDTNSVILARDGLQQVLTQLAQSPAEKVTVISHSLGNILLLETLRQMKLAGLNPLQNKKLVFVMAAPDVDLDVYEFLFSSLGAPANPVFVLVSRHDRALKLSRKLAGGYDRAGHTTEVQRLADLGVVVLDLAAVDAPDKANHVKFAQLAQFGPELQESLRQGTFAASASGFSQGLRTTGQSLVKFLGDMLEIVVTRPTAENQSPE